jgi:hypothetical protein
MRRCTLPKNPALLQPIFDYEKRSKEIERGAIAGFAETGPSQGH